MLVEKSVLVKGWTVHADVCYPMYISYYAGFVLTFIVTQGKEISSVVLHACSIMPPT